MNMNKFFVTLILYPLLHGSLNAQNAFSLQEAQEYAIKNHPNNISAKMDIDFANAQKNEIRAIGLPQLNGQIDFKDFLKIPQQVLPNFLAPAIVGTLVELGSLPPTIPVPNPDDLPPIRAAFGTKYNIATTASLSQVLFSSDYLIALQASKAFMELSKISLQRTDIETKTLVAKAYYSVLLNRERMKVIDANIERIEKLKKDIEALTETGFAELIDKDRVEVTYNNLVTEKEKFQKILLLTESLLKFQMFFPIDQQIVLKDSINIKDIALTENSSISKPNLSNRVEYTLIQKGIKLNELRLKQNRGSYLPSLVGYGSAGYSYLNTELKFAGYQWIPIVVVGATMNIPIFDGFSKYYKTQQAKINLKKSELQLKQFEQAALLEFNSAQTSYSNALLSLKTQQRNLSLAENVYNVSKVKYEQGIGSNSDVVNADAALKEAQTNLYSAAYDYFIAKVDLDKALGNIK